MENEIMNYENEVEVIEMEPEIVEDKKSGMSTGTAALIGAGVAFAGVAVAKRVKKWWANRKAQKELRQPDTEIEVTDEDVAEVTAK